MNSNRILLLNMVSTIFLTGLIWTVQQVHYPLFDRVGADAFVRYEADHNHLITPVVGPVMILEAVTSVLLVIGLAPPWFPRWAAWFGLAAVAMIWVSTIFLQVPCHGRLLQGFDQDTYQRLVRTNWIRTGFWTMRAAVMVFLLWQALQTPTAASVES